MNVALPPDDAAPAATAMPAPTGKGPLANLEARLAAGLVRADAEQRRVAERLQALHEALRAARAAPRTSGLLRFLGLGRKPVATPAGIYIWGPVGTGKSMLMDLFFADAPVAKKRRVHFHEFMLEVHQRLFDRRQVTAADGGESDTIPPIARAIASEARLLCFDEMQVTNIADAMILWRLFDTLLAEGVTVVATSNRVPDDLYKGGLQRDRFQPFIDLIKARLEVLALDGGRDYRLQRLRQLDMYLTPAGAWADRKLEEAFASLTDGAKGSRRVLRTQGRDVVVPRAAPGVAWADFEEWCGKPLGAADFLCIAEHFHTVILRNVPRLSPRNRDRAWRFTTLIDALYEKKVKLICSAEAPPDRLYVEGDGAFEFERVVSRLMEMQSPEYLGLEHIED
ncbi:cell division protein ZapE [Vineibacter terrae]|uniref:cell division protein ZapE n=1 Tax=Vineibacter terrae TaxID=2586908 RepID=UPI002E332D02|nr:cell division protein ZapE [Vineibacter terrae]HEX2890966.1 cell division protein ZapE [Vineibacter terrae]